MARRSLTRYGGTVCHEKACAKSTDQTTTRHIQPGNFTSNLRRSLRLKEVAAVYEAESAIHAVLSSKYQEFGTDTLASSPNQSKAERPLHESSNGPSTQKSNVVDVIDCDDDSNTSITLMDLLTRCKIKKRKASEVNEQANAYIKEHNNGFMMPKEDELELEETIRSLKAKKAKSSPTSVKSNEDAIPTPHSKIVLTFALASAAPESEPDESTLQETISDELPVGSEFDPKHKKENVDGKMKEFAEQNPFSSVTPTSFAINEVIETCLDGSDDENSITTSTVLINKCDFDDGYFGEVFDKVTEREDLEQPDNVISNIMDPFLRDIIRQCKHDFSSSASRLENRLTASHDGINVKNEHLVVGSMKYESAVTNHHKNLPIEVPQKDAQWEAQFEESVLIDKRDKHLIAAENPTKFIESDGKKLTCFLENDRWLVGNRKNSFSDMHLNERLVSLVSEYKDSYSCGNLGGPSDDSGVSLSLENHANFVDGFSHGRIERNNCSGAIHNHKSLDVGSDQKCSMVNENCREQVSQSMQPLSTCILSQMNHSFLSIDTVTSVDTHHSITEAGSPYGNPVIDDAKQGSHYDGDSLGGFRTTDYLLDENGWDPQIDKLLTSSQTLMLNRCSEGRPYAEVSESADAVKPEQIFCHCPVSQLHEIEANNLDQVKDGLSKSASPMDTIADLPTSSSLESSTQICVEKQINMPTTEIQAADKKFGGNLCLEVEHSPRKLLSNRKEISPNSQEKLLRALNNGGLDDVVKLSKTFSDCMEKLCFDKGATKKPLSSILDDGETLLEAERMSKKPNTMNQSHTEVTKGILKSPYTICCNQCCLKNSSIQAQTHDAILFSQRQMQDTENIATKLLKGLSSLKSIVEETLFSEGLTSSPPKFNFDEIRLATKHASKLEATTKKWLAMMAKDCNRFCKIMRLTENKLASPVNDLHKGRKKITFADEAGGTLCQIKVYEQQPVAFIFPKAER